VVKEVGAVAVVMVRAIDPLNHVYRHRPHAYLVDLPIIIS
jgi:hypothetical protein